MKEEKLNSIISGVFQKIHESFDEIDSEKMYPFYVEKESTFADCDYGERKRKAPLAPFLSLEILIFLESVENVFWIENSWISTALKPPLYPYPTTAQI